MLGRYALGSGYSACGARARGADKGRCVFAGSATGAGASTRLAPSS
jgi:hypothetical protein